MSQPYFNPGTREARTLSKVAIAIAIIALVAVIALVAYVLIEGFGGQKGAYVVGAFPLGTLGSLRRFRR